MKDAWKIGDYIIASNGNYKYTYIGNDLWKKSEIPFRVEIPTLRMAVSLCDIEKLKTIKCCHNCKHFSLCMFSAPSGWCNKYRGKQVNTGINYVCDDYDNKSIF